MQWRFRPAGLAAGLLARFALQGGVFVQRSWFQAWQVIKEVSDQEASQALHPQSLEFQSESGLLVIPTGLIALISCGSLADWYTMIYEFLLVSSIIAGSTN